MPAGLPILVDDIAAELARRRLGYGRGPRMRFEADELELIGGIPPARPPRPPPSALIHNSPRKNRQWAPGTSASPAATGAPPPRTRTALPPPAATSVLRI